MKTKSVLVAFVLILVPVFVSGQTAPLTCSQCAVWNVPQRPFRIYGNTYFVGPSGLTSILITSSKGHILIDGALAESASQIAASIRSLGFHVRDVKLILNSHVHYDHAGGIAELQRMSGARVAASEWSADVLAQTGLARDDPQYGIIPPIAHVAHVQRLRDGQSFRVGDIVITAHLTPGHTPGGTSWTWRSCENGRCLGLVYADSLTPVSADGYMFRDHPELVAGFQKSFTFLRSVPCDILLTSHPGISSQWDQLKAWRLDGGSQPEIDGSACRKLADNAGDQLHQRLEREKH